MTTLKIKKLHPDAIIPAKATEGAACFDLHCIQGGVVPSRGGSLFLNTGLAFEVPHGHALMIYSRSGHGFKNMVRLVNCVGVIDSDYRGEVAVSLTNDSALDYYVQPGDRVAQAMLIPVPNVQLVEAGSLSNTLRGEGGFGSTGS